MGPALLEGNKDFSQNKSPKKGKNTSGNPFINSTITFDSMAVW